MSNDLHRKVSDSLRNIAPWIADMFDGAVRILDDPDFSNEAKVRFVAHAGRDICNRLPSIVSGEVFERFNYSNEIDKLSTLLDKEGLKDSVYTKSNAESEQGKIEICVSFLFLESIQRLCEGHKNIGGTRKRKAEALIVGLVPENQKNPEAIIPLINEFKRLSDFFQGQAHIRDKAANIDVTELREKFDLLESTLHSLCGYYYSGYEEICNIVNMANSTPTAPDSSSIHKAIAAMGTPQFYHYFFVNMTNPNWLDVLKGKGYFDSPPNAEKSEGTISYRYWPQGEYLRAVAKEMPEKVLQIIKDVDTDNVWVMGACLKALNEMPVDVAAQGINLFRRILDKEFYQDWYNVGESASQLMIKFAEGKKWNEAFGIAEKLLSVKVEENKSSQSWHDLNGRFDDYHYKEVVFKHFKVLWEKDIQGLRAGKMLIEILDGQIENEQKRKDKRPIPKEFEKKFKEILGSAEEKPFDITDHSYILMSQIDAVEKEHPDIMDILVGGIRAIGEYLMENTQGDAEKYIDYLREKNRSLYERIIIHLHRHAPDNSQWNQRIKEIIRNVENVKNYNTANEYRSLLHDKYELLSNEDKKSFFLWVEKQAEIEDEEDFLKWYQEKHGRRAEESDIDKYQHYLRAKELYCIKDKETRFQEYLGKSGKSENAVKPWMGSSIGYSPEAKSYSPISQEQMKEKTPKEAIKYILEYDFSHKDGEEYSEEDGHPVDRKEALASVFSNNLKERLAGYLEIDASIISKLSRSYIRNFLYAICEEVQSKEIEEASWDKIINICRIVYMTRSSDENYREPMKAINRIFEQAFKKDTFKEKAKPEHLESIWGLLVALLDYKFEMDDGNESFDSDPFQTCANSARGTAFENIIRFGLFCKNYKPELFEKVYANKLKERLQYVLEDIGRPEVLCVFGVFFVNLCWIDEPWVQENINYIFPDENQERWDAIWKSYINWGRPSKKSFTLAEGKYSHAVEIIKDKERDRGEESYYKRLMEHIMLAYWQGWTDLEREGLVQKMLAKADDQLRAGASHWLSTGFEYLKDHKDDDLRRGVVRRMHKYWDWRSVDMEKDPSMHRKEAREFIGWVKDSPFDDDITLAIAEKAVDITGGVAMRMMRDVDDFVEGICAIAEGRELSVLLLLQKAIEDQEVERWSWQYEEIQEQLIGLMDKIVALPDGYEGVKKIRQAAIKVADSLGRLGFEYLRPHYDELTKQIKRGDN